jgi:hypothetical protein
MRKPKPNPDHSRLIAAIVRLAAVIIDMGDRHGWW